MDNNTANNIADTLNRTFQGILSELKSINEEMKGINSELFEMKCDIKRIENNTKN